MGDRCTGACCRRFTLSISHEELVRRAGLPDAANDLELTTVAAMVVPLGLSQLDNRGEVLEAEREWFRCRHVGPAGDCTIYERRPFMCRRFPYGSECEHGRDCTWDAARAGRVDRDGRELALTFAHATGLNASSPCVVPLARLQRQAP